jgi:anti-anti-sigma factor
MQYRFDEQDGILVAQLRGAIVDGPVGRQFCDAIREYCRAGRVRFVLDCNGVTRVTPFGMGILTAAFAQARNVGGMLVLARIPESIRSLLLITGFQAVFACYETVDAAVAAVREQMHGPPPIRRRS